MGNTATRSDNRDIASAQHQEPLEEVDVGSREWAEIERLVNERSLDYRAHYSRTLQLTRLWRVCETDVWQNREQRAIATYGNPKRLFHGTSRRAADSIVAGGFRLPSRAGMFGKGIYFVECPLK